MPLKSNEDGSYVASWVPSVSGRYLIQVYIDGKSAGECTLRTASSEWYVSTRKYYISGVSREPGHVTVFTFVNN